MEGQPTHQVTESSIGAFLVYALNSKGKMIVFLSNCRKQPHFNKKEIFKDNFKEDKSANLLSGLGNESKTILGYVETS